WQMRKALQSLLFADEELEQDRRERDPVEPAEASASAKAKKKTKQTANGMPAHSFATLLAHLATRCRNTHPLAAYPNGATFQQVRRFQRNNYPRMSLVGRMSTNHFSRPGSRCTCVSNSFISAAVNLTPLW